MRKLSVFALGALLVYTGCVARHAPLPLESSTKWQWFDAGNVAPNPNFEQKTFGWEGQGCTLSTRDSSGQRNFALKLIAVADTAAGCLSPSFKIKPGHYDFKLWLKTEGLKLSADRHLHEALSIRLRLFDHQARELSPIVSYLGQEIDGYELNYSLNRVDADNLIDGLDFHEVSLMPRFYPYDVGWIPPQAASAQIEIGLSGPGEVWVDDLKLNFSKWNFSLLERVEKLGLIENPDILPLPKELQVQSRHKISSVCFENTHQIAQKFPQLRTTTKGFAESIESLGLALRETCDTESLSIILRHTNSSTKQDAYKLKPIKAGIEVQAAGVAGFSYGLSTLRQLIKRSADGNIWIDLAHVSDWPTFTLRSVSGKDSRRRNFSQEVSASEWLQESRLATVLLEADAHNFTWWHPRASFLGALRRLRDERAHFGNFEFGVLLHPYAHTRVSSLKKEIIFSDPRTSKELYDLIRSFLELGASQIVLRMDDFAPRGEGKFEYILDKTKDRQVFGSLALAHAHLIRVIYQRMQRDFPKAGLSFVPPWYNNLFSDLSSGLGQNYLSELSASIPPSIPFFWTGPAVRSLKVDEVHLARFKALIGARQLIFWDNTLYARRHKDFWGKTPERYELTSLFEPYDVELPKGLFGSGIFFNVQPSELSRIQLATAGVYAWNPATYQPEQALWRHLSKRFGAEGALALLKFDQELNSFKVLQMKRAPESQIVTAKAELLSSLAKLSSHLGSQAGPLMDELREHVLAQLSQLPGAR